MITAGSVISHKGYEIAIPLPIYPVIEDVGWWKGEDGSANNQPFRNRFPRDHCLADYRALVHLAKRLGIRLTIGMVIGEWDRTDCLRDVVGATWMGRAWDNAPNRGPWLDEVADYIRSNRKWLEPAIHGLFHEFWQNGRMERSEFHDQENRMRAKANVRSHLAAYRKIMEQNGISPPPRIFIPPALHHSFGNNKESIQAILHEEGIKYVVTDFSRARQYSPPRYDHVTWEKTVILLDRGAAPVKWSEAACAPVWNGEGIVLPLHWANLLHPDPDKNRAVVDGWAEMLQKMTVGMKRMMAEDIEACLRQAALCWFGEMKVDGDGLTLDLSAFPEKLWTLGGPFEVKIRAASIPRLRCSGGSVMVNEANSEENIYFARFQPVSGERRIYFIFP